MALSERSLKPRYRGVPASRHVIEGLGKPEMRRRLDGSVFVELPFSTYRFKYILMPTKLEILLGGPALGPINAENEQDAIYSKLTVKWSNYLLQVNLTLRNPSERLATGGNISAPLSNTSGTRIIRISTGFKHLCPPAVHHTPKSAYHRFALCGPYKWASGVHQVDLIVDMVLQLLQTGSESMDIGLGPPIAGLDTSLQRRNLKQLSFLQFPHTTSVIAVLHILSAATELSPDQAHALMDRLQISPSIDLVEQFEPYVVKLVEAIEYWLDKQNGVEHFDDFEVCRKLKEALLKCLEILILAPNESTEGKITEINIIIARLRSSANMDCHPESFVSVDDDVTEPTDESTTEEPGSSQTSWDDGYNTPASQSHWCNTFKPTGRPWSNFVVMFMRGANIPSPFKQPVLNAKNMLKNQWPGSVARVARGTPKELVDVPD
ncbi:hypothetical protein B0H14DRAFT_2601214 [Mycena olivaceomarginata]|nr:hypothetical protein B0H14DRAFT_2601214 [Mycena olivaceomarginata]